MCTPHRDKVQILQAMSRAGCHVVAVQPYSNNRHDAILRFIQISERIFVRWKFG